MWSFWWAWKSYLFVYMFFHVLFRLRKLPNFLFHLSYGMSFMLLIFAFMDVFIPCIPFHCETYSKWALHNCSLAVSFFLCKNLSSWFNQYILAVHYTLWQEICCTLCPGENPLDHIFSQMFVYTTQQISTPGNV